VASTHASPGTFPPGDPADSVGDAVGSNTDDAVDFVDNVTAEDSAMPLIAQRWVAA
jgi:hypothetical protein